MKYFHFAKKTPIKIKYRLEICMVHNNMISKLLIKATHYILLVVCLFRVN